MLAAKIVSTRHMLSFVTDTEFHATKPLAAFGSISVANPAYVQSSPSENQARFERIWKTPGRTIES
jgi:hypothetical protein